MDNSKLWRISLYLTISLQCLAPSVAQVDECSPRCWNPVQPNTGARGATLQGGVASEEECKALCLNTESCIGIDWNKDYNGCWFQEGPLQSYNATNINHWSLANCTDECAPHCWKSVQIGVHVSGGKWQSDITDENYCKLRCSNTSNCIGIDWGSACYLLDTANPPTTLPGVRHWDIKRNLSTSCQITTETPTTTEIATTVTTSPHATTTTSVKTTTNKPTETLTSVASTSHSSISETSPSAFSNSSDSSSSHTSNTSAIIGGVVGGFCGLVLIIILIVVIIRFTRTERQSRLKSDIKSVQLDDNYYEGLQRAETKSRSKDETYADLVQVNPNELDNNYEDLQRPETKARSEDGTYTDLVQGNPVTRSNELDNNYEGLQRPETKARSDDATYTDLVQRYPKESVYEQTN